MAKAAKTKATEVDVAGFIAASARPDEGAALCDLMATVSGEPPRMWGPSIVGFGATTYPLAGGKTGETLAIGFSPRKPALVLYLPHAEGWEDRLARLGPHDNGKGCLYIKRLAAVDLDVLKDLAAAGWAARIP